MTLIGTTATILSLLLSAQDADAGGDLAIEARVVGVDGRPVEKSGILVWRLVPVPGRGDDRLWRDRDGDAWEQVGGAATGDRLRQDGLGPGTYRVTAHEGHHRQSPAGISDPVDLAPGDGPAVVTVRLRPGARVALLPVDAESGRPLPDASVSLIAEETDFPRGWGYGGERGGEETTVEGLPPGTYFVRASMRASRPDDLEYEPVEPVMRIEVAEGDVLEVAVPMQGRPLTGEEIDRRWGWIAVGTVTDEQGRPVEGATVRVATGMGTLYGGGSTTTDDRGGYTLRFSEGIWSQNDVNLQVASYGVAKEGYVERSRTRPGFLMMARTMPEPGKDFGTSREDIALHGKPLRLDFVLARPAVLEVEFVGPEDAVLSLEPGGNQDRWGASRRLDEGEGPARRWELLPGEPWQFTWQFQGPRTIARSQPFTLSMAGPYRLVLRDESDRERGVGVLEIVALDGPGGDLADEAVGDDPLARPPVPEAEQERGREFLRRMAEANRDWLGPAPGAIRSYSYRFRFAGEEGTTYEVGRGEPVPGVLRRGISHYSAIHHLAAHPESATFRQVNVGDDRIELAYTLREPIGISAGNGVSGTWRGFFSRPLREGRLTLDTRRLVPLEHRAEDLVETFSQFIEIDDGRYAPLSVAVDKSGMRFDWLFQVFEPGLWLFAEAYAGDGDESVVVATLDEVRIDGDGAERIAVGRVDE